MYKNCSLQSILVYMYQNCLNNCGILSVPELLIQAMMVPTRIVRELFTWWLTSANKMKLLVEFFAAVCQGTQGEFRKK